MLYLFIDTNIFLNFYTLSNDHLDKLEKILELLKNKELTLLLTEQVVDEFKRNREKKLLDFVKSLNAFQPKLCYPPICFDIKEKALLETSINKTLGLKKKLTDSLMKKIKKKELYADKLIEEIFSYRESFKTTDDILKRSERRMLLGNPPGKNGSFGDAINWECIIENTPPNTDLYFIGIDGDYRSDIDDNDFHPFLNDEWGSRNGGKIHYFKLISNFVNKKFPKLKITKDDIAEEKQGIFSSFSLPSYVNPSNPSLTWPSFSNFSLRGGIDVDALNKTFAEAAKVLEKTQQPLQALSSNSAVEQVVEAARNLQSVMDTYNRNLSINWPHLDMYTTGSRDEGDKK